MSEPSLASASSALIDPMTLLEQLPLRAYLLRAEGEDFVLEGVNALARATTPGLSAMLGRPVSLLYADQPGILADAKRCHRERVRVERETSVRRHERVDSLRQSLVFVSLDEERIVIFARDHGDQENASAELYEVQERYRSLLASLPDAMMLRGADGRIVAANEMAAKLLGYERASDLWGLSSAVAPGYRIETPEGSFADPMRSPSRRAAEGEIVRAELYRRIGPDGSKRWIRVSAQPVRKSDGSLGGSVTVYSDQTAQVEAELAEREAAKQLQMALDAGRMGTWEYDPQADTGSWSPALTETFKLGDEGPGIAGFLKRTHPDDRNALMQLMAKMRDLGPGKPFEHEHRIIGNDGVTRWARIRGHVEHSDGRLRFLGTAMDVTERRRMQDELLQAGRLESLGRLAGGLAHDFNNLLAAMLGSIELLGDVCPDSGQEDLATLRHVTLRARDLTAQLLAFARQQRIELATVDAATLLHKVERLLERLVGPRIELHVSAIDAPPEGLHVRADAAQLEQVLVNLVVNARDAMPNGGRITLNLGRELDADGSREWVRFEVHDQGRGIQKEHLGHVFDPFFTTKPTGTGLGLASSYGVVQTHGGSITVESEPGQGACFRVKLPRVYPEPALAAALPLTAPGKGRVLVVDDDDSVRSSTTRMLQTLGYEVLSAVDGAEAEALARQPGAALDLLVCDLAMPGKSGPEVARVIRDLYPHIKVLFVSGYPRGAERELPAESFLQKPYDREALARKLSALGARS